MAKSKLIDAFPINPDAIRSCVARIWETGFKSGSYLNRSMACSILASEFFKLGYSATRVENELKQWNRRNEPPLRVPEMGSTIRTADRTRYKYGCNHEFIKEFCIEDEFCSYLEGLSRGKKHNFRAFFTYRWQLILKSISKHIYWMALPEIEKRMGFKPGSRVYVGHRELAYFSGITLKYVAYALDELQGYGLIEYTAGTPRKWEKKASEIKRIFPIPKPPHDVLRRIKNYKTL